MYNPLISTSLALQPQDSIVSLSTASSSSSSSSSTSPDSKPSSTVSSRSASPIIFFEDDDYIIKDFSETSNTSLSYQPLISNNDIELLTATESTHSGADEFDSSFTNSQSPYTASSLYRQATIMDESSANLTDLSTDQWFAQKSSSSEPHSVDDQDNDDEQVNILSGAASMVDDTARDWTAEFQALLSKPTFSKQDQLDRQADLETMVDEFVEFSKPIVKTIVHERSMQDAQRTIPCVSSTVGGQAGGEKYMHKNVFFKFAVDSKDSLYGDDTFAMKAAGHELKGLRSYISCNIPHLHFPMFALFDYGGFRVTASSILPVHGKDTLVYGSDDGGKTVHPIHPPHPPHPPR
eukprot:TRINITY_DN2323_c0_g1_i4.p1 TRINITY_DN2323_c0_g1~~TRINITY_DN2323_c0_g1_i4.p1  ORF type:complete len:350 (-),score=80.71 TRINITY_DN2323_c0_g1_i4:1481-2530(-)